MNNADLVSFVLGNLKRMKLRVLLTVLGVVVGTTAIVAMVALGIGLQQSASASLLSFQSLNELTVESQAREQGGFAQESKKVRLDDNVIKKIGRVEGVKSVVPLIQVGDVAVKIGKHKATAVFIQGLDDKSPIELDKGRLPGRNSDKSIVLSNKFGSSFEAKDQVPTNQLLNKSALLKISRTTEDGKQEVRQIRVRIVGIAEEQGEFNDYGNAYMPLDPLKDLWQWQENSPNIARRQGYNSLRVTLESSTKADLVQKRIEDMGLYVFSLKEMLGGINSLFRIIEAVLGAIGAVALFVASLGIVNTMIMSIYERTREIGIMKAVGASNTDIIKIFLGEAGVIGLVGGVGGTLLGWMISKALGYLVGYYITSSGGGSENPLTLVVPIWLAVFAIVFATAVGLVSGIYPALRASELNPLVALRHE